MGNSTSLMLPDAIVPNSLKTIATITAVTAMAGWMAAKSKGREGEKGKKRWSLMSESLAHGTFPSNAKFDEAIINVVMIFDDNDRPTVDEVVGRCVKLLLKYERFSYIFDRKSSSASYCGENFDPYDLVRVIPVSDCSSSVDLLKVMEDQACAPLAQAPRGELLPWWEFVMLENRTMKEERDGKSAVVWRIHHSLGETSVLSSIYWQFMTKSVVVFSRQSWLNRPILYLGDGT